MYSNKILNFQEFTTILNACTKKVWKLIVIMQLEFKLVHNDVAIPYVGKYAKEIPLILLGH